MVTKMLSDFFVYSTRRSIRMPVFSFSLFWDKLLQRKWSVYGFFFLPLLASLFLFYIAFFVLQGFDLYILLIAFFVLGALYDSFINKNLTELSRTEKTVFFLLLAGEIFICFGVISLLFHRYSLLADCAVAGAFLLPFNIGLLWPFFENISKQNIVYWSYSDDLPLGKSTIFLNSIPIHFHVLLPEEAEERHITFRAPVRLNLGAVFYHMIQEQNNQAPGRIQLVGPDQTPYQWIFYTHHLLGWHVNLDPEKSFLENGIRQKSKIFATRLPVATSTSNTISESC